MRILRNFSACLALASALALTLQSVSAIDIVYSDAANDSLVNFTPGSGSEVGNEIVLAGTSRDVTFFRFQYFDTGTTESVDVRFYANDGSVVSGAASPGTLLYDSGSFSLPTQPTTRATAIFDQADLNGGIIVPDDFTWTITFSGNDAGLSLYSPPTVGSNFADEWVNTPSGWTLNTAQSGGAPIEFAAVVGAISAPDSSYLPVSALGILICLGAATIQSRRRIAV